MLKSLCAASWFIIVDDEIQGQVRKQKYYIFIVGDEIYTFLKVRKKSTIFLLLVMSLDWAQTAKPISWDLSKTIS